MTTLIKGNIYEHTVTKELLLYVPKKSIVFLWHENLDSVAVDGLLDAKVTAVINGKKSMTNTYVNKQVKRLLDAHIPVFDIVRKSAEYNDQMFRGERVIILNEMLYLQQKDDLLFIATLKKYDEQYVKEKIMEANAMYRNQYDTFVDNTLHYVKNERKWFKEKPLLPSSLRKIKGKDVFIVARNMAYERDIFALQTILKRKDVIIIAVDGAAEGLLKYHIQPHYIIGDMDSIQEKTLRCGATIICHAYPNGYSPGENRIKNLGLMSETIAFVGTSEDMAIAVSYWSNANHLYLIGCRFGMVEFLEKGRRGMGATLLSRMMAGDRITDLKGIHTLLQLPQRTPTKHKLLHTVMNIYHYFKRNIEHIVPFLKREMVRHD